MGKLMLATAAAVAGFALVAMPDKAIAETINVEYDVTSTTLGSITVGSDTFLNHYEHTYKVFLKGTDVTVSSAQPSKFTLFDVSGYIGGTASYSSVIAGTSFGFSAPNTGPSYSSITVADNGFVANLTGTYTGSDYTNVATGTGTLLGILKFQTLGNVIGAGKAASLDVKSSGIPNPPNNASLYDIDLPTGSQGPVGTPLPLAALGGMGLLGMMAAGRHKR
jgi:hypothetical protein